jgi:hypothetical protein
MTGLHRLFFPEFSQLQFGFLASDILFDAPQILEDECLEDSNFVPCQSPYKEHILTRGPVAGYVL